MWKDPIVEEVRKQRLKIESDSGNDFDKIFKKAMKIQEKIARESFPNQHTNNRQMRFPKPDNSIRFSHQSLVSQFCY